MAAPTQEVSLCDLAEELGFVSCDCALRWLKTVGSSGYGMLWVTPGTELYALFSSCVSCVSLLVRTGTPVLVDEPSWKFDDSSRNM